MQYNGIKSKEGGGKIKMKKKIENPKVFISYAWGTQEYQNKVLAFATQLVRDGIDVVLDKWDLTEGNDTFAFMEQCVTNPSITNVLMLLDPEYAKKADEHSGGVGTETQIISAQVYQEVSQDKFIPIVMERDEKGRVCKPTYLQGRLHFDLSLEEEYDNTYQRLVKKLYGIEVYVKPELGQKPSWVEKPITASPKSIMSYSSLRNIQNLKVRSEKFREFLDDISEKIIEFTQQHKETSLNNEEYIRVYDSTSEIKENYLLLLTNSPYIEEAQKIITEYFEETTNALSLRQGLGGEIGMVLIHELFLYTIAHYMKTKDYVSIGYILGKTYFNQHNRGYNSNMDGFSMFYSASYHENLDNAISQRDGKNYLSGTARYWTSNINNEFCSVEQFVLADLICFNYSVYGRDYLSQWKWFPLTYIYDNEFHSVLAQMGQKMVSKEYVQEIIPMFGYNNLDDFVSKFKTVEDEHSEIAQQYRYSGAFNSARLLGDFIKSDQLATVR